MDVNQKAKETQTNGKKLNPRFRLRSDHASCEGRKGGGGVRGRGWEEKGGGRVRGGGARVSECKGLRVEEEGLKE